MEYKSAEHAMDEMMKDHTNKIGPEEKTEKEAAKPIKFLTPTESRKKFGHSFGDTGE